MQKSIEAKLVMPTKRLLACLMYPSTRSSNPMGNRITQKNL